MKMNAVVQPGVPRWATQEPSDVRQVARSIGRNRHCYPIHYAMSPAERTPCFPCIRTGRATFASDARLPARLAGVSQGLR